MKLFQIFIWNPLVALAFVVFGVVIVLPLATVKALIVHFPKFIELSWLCIKFSPELVSGARTMARIKADQKKRESERLDRLRNPGKWKKE